VGYYIEVPNSQDKAGQIMTYYGATAVSLNEARRALQAGKGVICVVQNGPFDAAAFCYNEEEFDDFAWPGDRRPKTWLVMDRKEAEVLAGYKRGR